MPNFYQESLNTESQQYSGFYKKEVSRFLQLARTNICNSCEMFNNDMCMSCGCDINIKVLSIDESCPLNKW